MSHSFGPREAIRRLATVQSSPSARNRVVPLDRSTFFLDCISSFLLSSVQFDRLWFVTRLPLRIHDCISSPKLDWGKGRSKGRASVPPGGALQERVPFFRRDV